MPKLHFVKKARKDNSAVKKGESYYWWKFMRGPKRMSKTKPRPSQLTQSEFLSRVYSITETIEDIPGEGTIDELRDIFEYISSEYSELSELAYESFGNMPESLQYGPTGTMLEERADMAQELADNFQDLINQCDDEDASYAELVSDASNYFYEGE